MVWRSLVLLRHIAWLSAPQGGYGIAVDRLGAVLRQDIATSHARIQSGDAVVRDLAARLGTTSVDAVAGFTNICDRFTEVVRHFDREGLRVDDDMAELRSQLDDERRQLEAL